jgi:hypothetical protein
MFLIARARYLAAREEWGHAVGRVDPDGVRGPWLAQHFHWGVVAAWVDAGEVELAREAFDAIPRDALDNERLRRLERRLVDMEEARAMGYSVYPASYPLEERWKDPRALPARSETGAHRIAWYPARVIEADAEKVLLAIGVAPSAPGERKRTAIKELDTATWAKAARRTDEVPSGYWFVGSYERGEIQASPIESHVVEPLSDKDPLRFMTRWATTSPP